ncbi:MAG: amidohydrolase family protein [Rhodospirillaceae bacterium]|nr:amidohydrolase family protein [Rhodospirillaceae bacterium]
MVAGPRLSRWLCALVAGLSMAGAFADIAIVGGRVYTMESPEPLRDATVLISDGRIEAVGTDIEAPFEYQQIDATGKIVTPGLIESYSQLGLVEIWAEGTTVDSQVEEYAVGPSLDVSFAINPASTLFAVNRMGGVTRAVVAPVPGSDPFAGLGSTIRLGGDNTLVESRIALFGDVTTSAADFTGGSRAVLFQRLDDALEEAARFSPNRYRAEGNDYSRRDMTALKEFLRSGKPLVVRVDRAIDILRCIDLAESHGLRLVVLGGAEAWKVREALGAARAAVILSATTNLPTGFDALGARSDNAALLRESGVDVLYTGSETHNARNLRQLAGNAVANGVQWYDALDSLTRTAALTWGMADAGVLRPGAEADVVVWSGDPFEVTTWAVHVSIDGQLISNDSRQTTLYERYRDLSLPYGLD